MHESAPGRNSVTSYALPCTITQHEFLELCSAIAAPVSLPLLMVRRVKEGMCDDPTVLRAVFKKETMVKGGPQKVANGVRGGGCGELLGRLGLSVFCRVDDASRAGTTSYDSILLVDIAETALRETGKWRCSCGSAEPSAQ